MSMYPNDWYVGNPADDPIGLQGLYHPPTEFRPWEWELVITLPKLPKSDGYDVQIYEMRSPAQFYRLVALPTKNSVGVEKSGWALETGSGDEMARLIGQIAQAASTGMIGLGEN
jgi:hypothetical protein